MQCALTLRSHFMQLLEGNQNITVYTDYKYVDRKRSQVNDRYNLRKRVTKAVCGVYTDDNSEVIRAGKKRVGRRITGKGRIGGIIGSLMNDLMKEVVANVETDSDGVVMNNF